MFHSISARPATVRAFVIAIAAMLVLFAWLSTMSAPVSAQGNNGTVKIHEGDTENEPIEPNDPKVCTFHVHAWNFDQGQDILISIVGHGGPNAGTDSFSATISADTNGEHGWEARTVLIELSDGMYKLTVDTGNGTGTQDKHKVFKVDCPDQPGPSDTGDVPLLKVDQTGAGRAGAVFTLTGVSGTTFTATATTTANGSASFAGLAPGSYSLTETTAPAGCTGFTGSVMVTVAADGAVSFGTLPTGVTVVDGTVRVVNNCGGGTTANGNLPLLKVDASGAGRAGAQFTLTGVSGTTFTATVTTAAGGTATFGQLAPGSYSLVETRAPAQCTGITAAIAVTVASSGAISVGTLPTGVSFTNGTLRIVNNCAQGGNLPSGGGPAQAPVRQGTLASVPNTAMPMEPTGSLPTLLGVVLLLGGLGVASVGTFAESRTRV